MLDDLLEVIETLKGRMTNHGPILRDSKTRTRIALIHPVLTVLGWNVSDPALVLPEYDFAGHMANYALLDGTNNPIATLQAEKLGEHMRFYTSLTMHTPPGIRYAGRTDGDRWELYETRKSSQQAPRAILVTSIANTPAHETALKLLTIWRPNLQHRSTAPAGP